MTDEQPKKLRDHRGRFIKTMEGAERDAEAVRMLAQHATYQQISDTLGYGSKSNAHKAVKRTLAAVPAEAVQELRAMATERLEWLCRETLAILDRDHLHISQGGKVVVDGDGNPILDDGPKLAALGHLRGFFQEWAKLTGVYQPARSRMELGGDDERERELLTLIEQLKAAGTGDGEPAGD